jgi:hypothetical protein
MLGPQAEAAPAAIESAYERKDAAGLVAILQRHAADPALAYAGCERVAELAHYTPAARGALGEAGAVAAVLAAMRAQAAHGNVQGNGCLAVYYLVNRHAANKALARAAGAAAVVRTAVANHPGFGDVQYFGGDLLKKIFDAEAKAAAVARAAVGLGPEATEAELAAAQVRGAVIIASTERTCRHHPISALSPPLTSMSRLSTCTVPGILPVHI